MNKLYLFYFIFYIKEIFILLIESEIFNLLYDHVFFPFLKWMHLFSR